MEELKELQQYAVNWQEGAALVLGDGSLAARVFTPPNIPGAPSPTVGLTFNESLARSLTVTAGAAFPKSVTITMSQAPFLG